MRGWAEDALDLLDRVARVALVSIVEAAGSAPREAGTKMLVTADEAIGTIGGGALEYTCIDQARVMLSRPEERARAQDYPLGPLLGQCCGGYVRIALDILTPADRDWLQKAAAFEARGEPYRLALPIKGIRYARAGWPPGISNPTIALLDEAGAPLEGAARKSWKNRMEYARPRARNVLLIGGGHVGAALALMLRQLPLQLDWIDSRAEDEEGGAALGGARLSADPVRDVQSAAPNTVYLIMTHSHALDFDLLAAALRRRDALYCGVIGSKTKRQRFVNRLARAGFPDSEKGNFVCPIGAARLSGKEPGVIALAVAMEIMQCFEAYDARQDEFARPEPRQLETQS